MIKVIAFSFIVLIFSSSCTKTVNRPVGSLAILTTTVISNITTNTAQSGGNISSDGGSDVTERGICFNTSPNPTTSNTVVNNGSAGIGSYDVNLSGLAASTIYYVRAYAINGTGTAYGNELSFTALAVSPGVTIPVLMTNYVIWITQTTANCAGMITSNGGSNAMHMGICWSTTSGSESVIGAHTDEYPESPFQSNLIDLSPGTTYYVKAYATNAAGTGYGNELSFTTLPLIPVPVLVTYEFKSITSTGATSLNAITANEGGIGDSAGICWSTVSGTESVAGPHVSIPSISLFYSYITGLSPNTTYYAKAFASNSAGIGYGNEITFTTTGYSNGTLTDIDGNVYAYSEIGTQYWMQKNLSTAHYGNGDPIPQAKNQAEWSRVRDGAWCWYEFDSAKYAATYGRLYNWYAVTDPRGLAPGGWHVAASDEWKELAFNLGGNQIAGGKMKETGTVHWNNPNTDATNSSGFTGLPGGAGSSGGTFLDIGNSGNWWGSNSHSGTSDVYFISYDNTALGSYLYAHSNGNSVRCVKD